MNIFIWAISFLVLFLDQLTKHIALSNLTLNESKEVIKGIFHFTLIRNTGAAFGIFKNQTSFFIAVSILAILAIIFILKRGQKTLSLTNVALALILGGSFGNLIDRLRFGCVIDFLDFRIWPVFNIADSAITMGAFLLIMACLFQNIKSKRERL